MLHCKIIFACLLASLLLLSCGNHDSEDMLDVIEIIAQTGWLSSKENLSNIPQDISIFNMSSNNLPDSVSLESKFPPVGDQGQYGTCVAWATGYNLKTALNGIEKGWSSDDLTRLANQTSPKDLWFTLNISDRGSNCGGTSFEAAFDALVSKGAATFNSVPYSNMGNCSGTSDGNSSNKLANYRMIGYNRAVAGGQGNDGMTAENFKSYLAQGRPIVIGARLGDRFMRWNSSSVISSDTYNDPGMQHAYHAMVLTGYDNNRQAFRLLNSWGKNWGDNGSIWVNYDFFLENFTLSAFVAQNQPQPVNDKVDDDKLLPGYDLLVAFAEDNRDFEISSHKARFFSYDIYNAGKNTILASQNWTVYYMYYNASNAKEFGIIFEDYYTADYGSAYGSLNRYGEYKESEALAGGYWNNMNILPGKKAGEEAFPAGFEINYEMPNITGKYYLVVYADALNKIEEDNEDNNFYFLGAANGKPLEIINGELKSEPVSAKIIALSKEADTNKIPIAPAKSVQEIGGNPNAYTPAEIQTLILHSKQNGTLAKKIEEYRGSEKNAIKKHHRSK